MVVTSVLKKVKMTSLRQFVLSIPIRDKGLIISKSAFMPKRLTVFDFVYMVDDHAAWVTWQNMTKAVNIDEELGTDLMGTSKNSKEVG